MKFSEYFRRWIETYKKGVVRDVTYRKYVMAYNHLLDICPELEAENLNKATLKTIYLRKAGRSRVALIKERLKTRRKTLKIS